MTEEEQLLSWRSGQLYELGRALDNWFVRERLPCCCVYGWKTLNCVYFHKWVLQVFYEHQERAVAWRAARERATYLPNCCAQRIDDFIEVHSWHFLPVALKMERLAIKMSRRRAGVMAECVYRRLTLLPVGTGDIVSTH